MSGWDVIYLESECLQFAVIIFCIQLNVGCFMAGPPIFGPAMPCGHSAADSDIPWMAALIASATTFAITSLMIYSVAILI